MFELYQEPTIIPYIIALFSLLTTFFIWLIPGFIYQNIIYISTNQLISHHKIIFGSLLLTFINWLGFTLNFYFISVVYLSLVYLSSKKIEQKSIKWINISMLLFMYFIIGVYAFFNYKIHYITYVFFSSNDIVNYHFDFKPYFKTYHVGDFLGSVSFSINNKTVSYTNEPIQYRIYMFYYCLHFIGLSVWSFIYFDILKKHKISYKEPYQFSENKKISANEQKIKDNHILEHKINQKDINTHTDFTNNLHQHIEKEIPHMKMIDLLSHQLTLNEKNQFDLREQILSIKEKEFELKNLKYDLENHAIFKSLKTIKDVQYFMSQHIFAVWDFMSLLKRLQKDICCVDVPWISSPYGNASRIINEIVLGEESDQLPNGNYASHFDLYLLAMNEIKADTQPISDFIHSVKTKGFEQSTHLIPEPARTFVQHTMNIALKESLVSNLGSFFNGRENVIPSMFSQLLKDWQMTEDSAPMFHYYLIRHIELDSNEHGPAGEKLTQLVIGENPQDYIEFLNASISSIQSRIHLWNEVSKHLHSSLN